MGALNKIDLNEQGLNHSPLIRSLEVEIDPPSLKDNTSPAERLTRAVEKAGGLVEIRLPLSSARDLIRLESKEKIKVQVALMPEGERARIIEIKPASQDQTLYGLAVDVGSTTLVLSLVDLNNPQIMQELSLANPQIEHGADILTRAHFAERGQGLQILVSSLRQAVNDGVTEVCRKQGIDRNRVLAAAFAGNTAMTHFLLGFPTSTLIREPYVPVVNRVQGLVASDLDLNIHPQAPLLIMPNKGSYFGGDLMAGLAAAGFNRTEETCILVDVGTNAEVVLGQRDWLIGAAGAAGPALEGGVASMGMVAAPGAIDQVRIDRDSKEVSYRTIGDLPPRGICGSGLIDLYAELFLSGLINFQGKLTLLEGHARRLETDEGPAFVVVPGPETATGEPILFSEVELDILTRSKAGMYTILTTVLKSVGLTFDQVSRFYVAGTFGQYINPRMAVAVGMLPDIPLDRYISLGNSSLKGAILSLISSDARQAVNDIWKRLTYLELNVNQEFMNRFSAARFIPHTHAHLFPSVGKIIK